MRSSLRTNNFIQTCLILTFAIASDATRFQDSQASLTAPPSTASLKARTPDFSDLNKPCGAFDHWVKAAQGDSCQKLARDNGITMPELIVMNPDINDACSNLVAGHTYCVGQLGAIANPGLTCTELPNNLACECNNKAYYPLMTGPFPSGGGPCDYYNQVMPPAMTNPPTGTNTPKPSTKTPTTTPAPAPVVTSPPVFRTVCLSTPSTCLSGSIGTDGSSYASGCCNGCGTAGACNAAVGNNGPLTWVCGCDGIMGRDFNGFIGNTTWVA